MAFNLDAVVDETNRAPWEVVLGGRTWRLPHVADLTLEQQQHADQGRPDLAVGDALALDVESGEWVPAGDACAKALRSLRGPRRGAFIVAWLAHAGMQPGESPASSS